MPTGAAQRALLVVPTGHNVGNLLRGGVMDAVLEHCPGLELCIVSPFADDADFRREFARPGVSFEFLQPYVPHARERVVESILCERFLRESKLSAVRLQRDRSRLLENWRGRGALTFAKAVLCSLPVSREAWFDLARAVGDRRGYDRLFDRLRPSVLLTSTGGFVDPEMPLIWEAARRGVPHVALDLGWDNLSSKYHTIRPAARLAVWNEQMRDEAVRYHHFSPDRVVVTGAVQFDQYSNRKQLPLRHDFLRSVGAPESAKLVAFATPSRVVFPYSGVVIDGLARSIAANEFGMAVHLLVRVHPRDDADAYAKWRDLPFVTVEKPFDRLGAAPGTQPFDRIAPSADDRRHLAATLANADVVVNCASTTTVEACLFDTPVVNVAFDGEEGLPLPLSVRRYYHYEHYRPVIESGAAQVAWTPEELTRHVRSYLNHPEQDRDARRDIVTRFCGDVDGRAKDRVAAVAVEMLHARRDRAAA